MSILWVYFLWVAIQITGSNLALNTLIVRVINCHESSHLGVYIVMPASILSYICPTLRLGNEGGVCEDLVHSSASSHIPPRGKRDRENAITTSWLIC